MVKKWPYFLKILFCVKFLVQKLKPIFAVCCLVGKELWWSLYNSLSIKKITEDTYQYVNLLDLLTNEENILYIILETL